MNIYLPIIGTGNPAKEFANLVIQDARQKRVLKWNDDLAKAAEIKVGMMILHNIFAHIVTGIWPNEVARLYVNLPTYYGLQANNVESLVKGSKDVNLMFESLANSPSHAKHLFGLTDFFYEQTDIGIGYGEGHNNYWYAVYISKVV